MTKLILDLSKNEPPPLAAAIVQQTANEIAPVSHLYPLASQLSKTEELMANRFSVPGRVARIFRGIDDCVDSILAAYPKLMPLVLTPTFSGFTERLRAFSRDFESIDLGMDYQWSPAMLKRLQSHHLLLLANPANPTGTVFRREELQSMAKRVGILLVDQAYIDFADDPESFESCADGNVLTFISFSKAWCLASFRLGVLCGQPERVSTVRQAWPPNERVSPRYSPFDLMSLKLMENVVLSLIAQKCAAQTRQVRDMLVDRLQKLDIIVRRSQTNFLCLLRHQHGHDLYDWLKARQILVRPLDDMGCPEFVRIGVPGTEGAFRLINELAEIKFTCVTK